MSNYFMFSIAVVGINHPDCQVIIQCTYVLEIRLPGSA